MDETKPAVSVIIATYNYAMYLPEAIDSVLQQTFRNFEVLVIDDGSTDNTSEVMQRYGPPVRYIRQANAGVAAARNRGIAESCGDFIGFLDADDTWLPSKLDEQVSALLASPQCRVCYTPYILTDRNLQSLGVVRPPAHATLQNLLFSGNVVGSLCTVLADRRLFQETSGFDPALSQCADWDMWIRLAALTPFLYLDTPLVTYRRHEVSMSTRIPLLERDSLHVLEKGFSMAAVPETMRREYKRAFGRNYMVLAGSYYHARQYRECLRCLGRALALDPRQMGRVAGFPARLLRRTRARKP